MWHPSTFCLAGFVFVTSVAFGTEVRLTPSAERLHVGETVTITIEAVRDTSAWGTRFSEAALVFDEHWRPGGQSVGSEKAGAGRVSKVWQFQLHALYPGTTLVAPTVYLTRGTGDLDMGTDSVTGAAATIVILPDPGPRHWPWFVGAAVAFAVLFVAARTVQRRHRHAGETRRPLPPPLDEALEMLTEARADRRTDRAGQYFSDVERIVYGYLSRRLGRALPAVTASEAAVLVSPHVGDREALGMIEDVLRRCATARFGGGRAEFEDMTRMEEMLRTALERLDASWGKI